LRFGEIFDLGEVGDGKSGEDERALDGADTEELLDGELEEGVVGDERERGEGRKEGREGKGRGRGRRKVSLRFPSFSFPASSSSLGKE